MKFAMCNEFCQDWTIEDTCALAQRCGYDGIEFAPFTLGESVLQITREQRHNVRRVVEKHGLQTVGLHWLLARTQGLHIHHPDPAVRQRTQHYYQELIACCADLGGTRMIHGSPQQRALLAGETREEAVERTVAFFAQAAPVAESRGVTLCIEPLGRDDADFINTAQEAIDLITRINHRHVRLILDCKAMADEPLAIPQIIRLGAPWLAHFHANDDNRSYPGTGGLDFAAIMATLKEISYDQWVSIEVFDFRPPPQQIAQEGLRHLRASLA